MRAIFWHVKVVVDWIVKFLNEFHWTTASEPGWCKIYPRGLCDVWGGFLRLVSTGQFSQRKITRSIPRFALSNHLFPYRESGTPSFLSSLNLVLCICKYREIPPSVPEYVVDSGKQDVWSISVSRVRFHNSDMQCETFLSIQAAHDSWSHKIFLEKKELFISEKVRFDVLKLWFDVSARENEIA